LKAFRLLALLILTSFVISAQAKAEEGYDSSGESSTVLPFAEGESGYQPSRILPQVGGALSTVVGDRTGEARNKPGLQVGVTADFGSTDFVFESGLLYRQMGSDVRDGAGELTANYLSIPVFAKYYFQGVNETSLYVKGGVLTSVLVHKEEKIGYGVTSGPRINDFDFGPAVGVGAKFPAGTSSEFFVEANYYRGLIQLWENTTQYNSSLAFMGGFSLAL
jgi:hypothetical protein